MTAKQMEIDTFSCKESNGEKANDLFDYYLNFNGVNEEITSFPELGNLTNNSCDQPLVVNEVNGDLTNDSTAHPLADSLPNGDFSSFAELTTSGSFDLGIMQIDMTGIPPLDLEGTLPSLVPEPSIEMEFSGNSDSPSQAIGIEQNNNHPGLPEDNGDGDLKQRGKRKMKKSQRHTPEQIRALEEAFRKQPHPRQKEIEEISGSIRISLNQVKFWYQNKRTQVKIKYAKGENVELKKKTQQLTEEVNGLQLEIENIKIGYSRLSDINKCLTDKCEMFEMKNKHLVERICTLEQHNKLIPQLLEEIERIQQQQEGPMQNGKSEIHNSYSSNSGDELSNLIQQNSSLNQQNSMSNAVINNAIIPYVPPTQPATTVVGSLPQFNPPLQQFNPLRHQKYAKEGLQKMIIMTANTSLWISTDDGKEVLNVPEYERLFNERCGLEAKQVTRDTKVLSMSSYSVVQAIMEKKLEDVFPTIVSRSTSHCLLSVPAGYLSGKLDLVQAEIHALSPCVPKKDVRFLRYCEKSEYWAVVELDMELTWRVPKGFIIEDCDNGYSKVTCLQHMEMTVPLHQDTYSLYHSRLNYGANRWLSCLQIYCDFDRVLSLQPVPPNELNLKRRMMMLSHRMTHLFSAALAGCNTLGWETSYEYNDLCVRVQRNKVPKQRLGCVLCVSFSQVLHVPQDILFDYLRDPKNRPQWDGAQGRPKELEQVFTNCIQGWNISLFTINEDRNYVLQRSLKDDLGCMVVSTILTDPLTQLDTQSEPFRTPFLPSGYVILPYNNHQSSSPDSANSFPKESSVVTLCIQVHLGSQESEDTNHEPYINLVKEMLNKVKTVFGIQNNVP